MKKFILIILTLWIPVCAFSQKYTWKKTNFSGTGAVYGLMHHKNMIFAGTAQGIYTSSDDGISWEKNAAGISSGTVYNFRKDSNNTLYAIGGEKIIRSINDGDTWAQLVIDSTPVPISYLSNLEVTSEGNLYVIQQSRTGSDSTYLLLSSNSGSTWNIQSTWVKDGINDMKLDAQNSIYIASGTKGLFYSADNGVSFLFQENLPTIDPGKVFISKTNDVYIDISDGGFCRKNGSSYFEHTNLPLVGDGLLDMLFLDNGNMYASTQKHGVFRSDDGINWVQIVTGLHDYFVRSLSQTPSGSVVCGTSNGEIYSLEVTNSVSEAHGADFCLSQNPASVYTSITYILDKPSFVTSSLVDVQGRVVKQQMKSWMDAGSHEMPLDVSDLPNGVYAVFLRTNDELMTTKLVVSR